MSPANAIVKMGMPRHLARSRLILIALTQPIIIHTVRKLVIAAR
jgi:hypothetical protein